ncbi:MAG: hypothetical protein R3B06_03070 [Kofleriaceae bacterium]
MMKRASVLSFVLLAVGACDSVPSTDVTTAEMGMWVFAEVGADGQADVTTGLTTDNPALLEVTYVNLEAGDTLSARLGDGAPQMMSEWTALGLYQYKTRFTAVAGGETLHVAFDRAAGQSAGGTQVTLPGAVAVTASAPSFAWAEGVTVSWTGGAGATSTQLAVNSPDGCFDSFSRKVDFAAGQARLAATDFMIRAGAQTTCAVNVTVGAVATGTADAAFGRGGNVTARQTRTLALTMTR